MRVPRVIKKYLPEINQYFKLKGYSKEKNVVKKCVKKIYGMSVKKSMLFESDEGG